MRDVLLNRKPADWDITTDATPEQIQELFSDTYYNNVYGTVVVHAGEIDVEVTPYRTEVGYSDQRHPDEVHFGKSLREDLLRRDFTMNAIAYGRKRATAAFELVDPFNGQNDIRDRLIRTVGNPDERFREDALRLLRALRFTSTLGFHIERATWDSIIRHVPDIERVSRERIRDELLNILVSDYPITAFWLMLESGMMKIVLPELEHGAHVGQNLHHIYSVLFHNLLSMQYCPSDDPLVRLAALLHDVGKPDVKQGDGKYSTFHGHDIVGARIARRLMRRLKFSNEDIEKVTHLVRHHMFYYSIGEVSDAGVRRLLKRIGPDQIEDFLAVRIADRMGSGTQVEMPKKLHVLLQHMHDVQRDPISVTNLAVNGYDLIKEFHLEPSPIIGALQEALLEKVLDDPSLNTREKLFELARGLDREQILAEYRERRKKNQEESRRLFEEGVDAQALAKEGEREKIETSF